MKQSLKKEDKLRFKSEFDYVRANGRKHVGKYMLLVSALPPDGKLRCGVICGKKFSKKAVCRNRARRLLWESFRLLKDQIQATHLVLVSRNWLAGRKQAEIQAEMLVLLRKAGVLKKSPDSPQVPPPPFS